MPSNTPWTVSYNFSADPSATNYINAAALQTTLQGLQAALADLQEALAVSLRDDDTLTDSSVTLRAISSDTILALQSVISGSSALAIPAAASVGATQLVDGGVSAVKLAADAVTTTAILDDAVTTDKILDANVTAAKLASDAVTTAKILDANVTAAKLAADAVITAKILDANVTAAKLASDAVTTAKILDANVTAAKLASDAVTTAKILNANVTAAKLGGTTLSLRQAVGVTAAADPLLTGATLAAIRTSLGVKGYLEASVVYDPAPITTGSRAAIQTLACAGVTLGMPVRASFSLDLQGLSINAWVSAADTISFQFFNPTAGALDLGSGTVTVRAETL